jgi:hypothetical protein
MIKCVMLYHFIDFEARCSTRRTKMLLNWEFAGPDRYFAIRVTDVGIARAFYKTVFRARELSQPEACIGQQTEAGLAIRNTKFFISSQDDPRIERPVLSLLAQEFGVPYIAIILAVDDRESIAARAIKNGAQLDRHSVKDAIIVADPFASHWALLEQKPAIARPDGSLRLRDSKILH